MVNHEPTQTLDVTGKNCPMSVVKAKQTIDELPSGEKAGTGVLKHYVRRRE
jgi:tRNA 2-thiouridine synthesizing protein A